MAIEFKKKYLIGISLGLFIIIIDFLIFFSPMTRWFRPVLALAFIIATLQFWIDFFNEAKRQKEIEQKFLEFARNLVETVKSGIPIPKSILNIANEDYGALSPYVKKLARQIEWGIPTKDALLIFSKDTKNKVVKRSISIVIEAEQSGGNIDDVLQSVTESVLNIKKMKEERKTSAYSQIVQGYIVFFVFIIIMLVLQIKLIPSLSEVSGAILGGVTGEIGVGVSAGAISERLDIDQVFLSLILIQGFFAGIMIGRFSEGDIKSGLKHSLILMFSAYIVITTIRGVNTIAPIFLIYNFLKIKFKNNRVL